ncbi:MAG: type IA DNA topoisomerase [Lachnospiraceae bacterium]|nr:type IA DNA topoisomerase [Lachnospiraceae bacterium]
MDKSLFIAEKPSVAREFAKALKLNTTNKDGYMESENCIITWCVGHLVTMSYPEAYDEKFRKWSLETIPFIPTEFKYEVIPEVKKQFSIVSGLLNREDVKTIYVCTDSGREGEYIYRLVEQQANVTGKERKRVWIDSQTEDEIRRGIKEAKDLSEYDNLSASAYLRAKEDYLMGINFSRALTLKYGYPVKTFLNLDKSVISVGRVMTCVLGIVVNREREIRDFVKTPFFRVIAKHELGDHSFDSEWKVSPESMYHESPKLYKENGFKEEETAKELIGLLQNKIPVLEAIEKKKETKAAPLLYNLAELQNDCSKYFKISPDETLRYIQDMYEKKLLTYPRTDARVLSSAVAKEIYKNLSGLKNYPLAAEFASEILEKGSYKGIIKSKYVNDKQITDHYAIIPTGQGLNALNSLNEVERNIYEIVVRRFLAIFYPPAVYQKVSLVTKFEVTKEDKAFSERFYSNFKVLAEKGYLCATQFSFAKKRGEQKNENKENEEDEVDLGQDESFFEQISSLKKGMEMPVKELSIKEGETSPPKRYNSGSIILTMENAGQFIEDEELRAQIKGSGIGTSATRAEILKKLCNIKYLKLNAKTQIITPTLLGEIVYEVVNSSIRSLLDPSLTASWEKGLTKVAEGEITSDEYMDKLDGFVRRRTDAVKGIKNQNQLTGRFQYVSGFYKK